MTTATKSRFQASEISPSASAICSLTGRENSCLTYKRLSDTLTPSKPMTASGNRKQNMKLIMQHAPNPDIRGGYWQDTDAPKNQMVEVATVKNAIKIFRDWIEINGFGSGNLTRKSGEVWADKKTLVGRISYNGRFWDKDGKEILP